MSAQRIAHEAALIVRVHTVTALCLVPVAAFAFLVLGSWPLAVVALVPGLAMVLWARSWYGSLAHCGSPAGSAVVTSVRHTAGILAEMALEWPSRELRMLAWTTRPPTVGEHLDLFGDPAAGVYGAVGAKHTYLSAVPGSGRLDASVTRPGTPPLTGGDGPRVGGRTRRR